MSSLPTGLQEIRICPTVFQRTPHGISGQLASNALPLGVPETILPLAAALSGATNRAYRPLHVSNTANTRLVDNNGDYRHKTKT